MYRRDKWVYIPRKVHNDGGIVIDERVTHLCHKNLRACTIKINKDN